MGNKKCPHKVKKLYVSILVRTFCNHNVGQVLDCCRFMEKYSTLMFLLETSEDELNGMWNKMCSPLDFECHLYIKFVFIKIVSVLQICIFTLNAAAPSQ